jgi:hypothetical protein
MKDLDVMNDKINDANADIDSPLEGMLDEKGNLTLLGSEVLGIDGYLGDSTALRLARPRGFFRAHAAPFPYLKSHGF